MAGEYRIGQTEGEENKAGERSNKAPSRATTTTTMRTELYLYSTSSKMGVFSKLSQ